MLKNENYGNFVDGVFQYAPNKLINTVNDENGNSHTLQLFGGSAEQYAAQGYFPVVKTPKPTDGGQYTEAFTQTDGVITQSWEGGTQ